MAHSQDLFRAKEIASSIAKEYSHSSWGAPHLLKALLHNEFGIASSLAAHGKDVYYLRDWADVRIENYPKSGRISSFPVEDPVVLKVFDVADLVRLQYSKYATDLYCVFVALLKPDLAFTSEQLKSLSITQKEALGLEDTSASVIENKTISLVDNKSEDQPAGEALAKYCTDKTKIASQGKLDPIIGRDKELRMILEVFGRRTKPNVILTGEPGVGKSALVDGLALYIINNIVPDYLKGGVLFELDSGALVAGASYKGEVEDRVKMILKEIKQFDKAILFIDEIHSLLDKNGALQGIANLLKPDLARGEITLIGATTPEEYRKYIESDEAFSRRFEVIKVEEPDIRTAYRMIKHIIPLFEKHHNISVNDEAIREAIYLSKRYIKDRRLPDAAIDLLDRTMASIKTMEDTSAMDIGFLKEQIEKVRLIDDDAEKESEYKWLKNQIKNRINPILLSQDEIEETEAETLDLLSEQVKTIVDTISLLSQVKKETVDKGAIASVVAAKTGIPLGKIQSKERDKLLGIENVLEKRVIGQTHAIKALSEAILESRSGLIKAGQPIGSFFMLGPTGTGKTELAKSLADFLFNDEAYLIRFDMSEFKEEHSAALLYGAPPGYIGYEEGGLLVNKIRHKPYSVVLFDEIEKAHPSVFDIFLQILDEGKMHDRLGKEGDFSNAVILFTSNIGSEFVVQKFDRGEIPTANELMEIMSKHFRPEFLARLTEIVPFAPITEENLAKIFEIHLRGLTDLLTQQGITLEVSSEAKKQIAHEGFTPKYGVRPLKGVIRNKLRRPISRMIIAGELIKGSVVNLNIVDGKWNWNIIKEPVRFSEQQLVASSLN